MAAHRLGVSVWFSWPTTAGRADYELTVCRPVISASFQLDHQGPLLNSVRPAREFGLAFDAYRPRKRQLMGGWSSRSGLGAHRLPCARCPCPVFDESARTGVLQAEQ